MKDMDIDYSALSHMKSLDETDQEIPTSSKERRKIKVSSLTGKKDESKKKQKIEKIPKTLKMNDVEGSENKSEEFQLDKKHNRAISDISSQDDLEKESFTCGSSSKIGNVLRANLGPLEHTNRGNTRTESDKNSLKDVKILECVTDDDEDVGGGNQEVSTKHLFRRVLSSSEENISLMTPKDWDSDNAEDSIVTAPPKFPRKNISSGPKNTYKTASTTVYSESENNSSEMDDDDVDEEVKRKSRKRKKLSRVPTKKRNKPVYKSPVRRLGESDEENISDEGAGGLKLMRKQTEQRMQALINSLRNPQFEKQFESLKLKNTKPSTSTARKTKRGRNDSTFKFSGKIPLEQRKSSRLQKKRPEYSPDVIDELHETLRQTYFKKQSYKILESSLEDLKNSVFKRKRKFQRRQKVEERIIIPVEAVTQKMLDNIALRVKGKVYSADGTTCHQCRQKTIDQKTSCRSPTCSGILGMFCGVCIKNRYGEDAAEALLNPNWVCPVCRGKCNCSICRIKQGKRPTGVLAPLVQQSGYESVDHYLDTLNGEGDRLQDDLKWTLKRDAEALLGFSNDGQRAHFNDGSAINIICSRCAYKNCDKPDNLLGFSMDGNTAVMGGKNQESLSSCNHKNHCLSFLELNFKEYPKA